MIQDYIFCRTRFFTDEPDVYKVEALNYTPLDKVAGIYIMRRSLW